MFFKVLILSVIEGLTEFLPISSTGHLILASEWLSMDKAFYEVFDIVIQFGAIMAVFFLFPNYFKGVFTMKFLQSRQCLVIGISILPILCLGFVLKDFIKGVLFSPIVIFWGLINLLGIDGSKTTGRKTFKKLQRWGWMHQSLIGYS